MDKHTEGPWRAEIAKDMAQVKADGMTVAYIGPNYITEDLQEVLDDEGKANARLIAAAPEAHELVKILADAVAAGGELQLGPKGRHANLHSRLVAYFTSL